MQLSFFRRFDAALFISLVWLIGMFAYANWGNKKGNDTLTWDTFGYYLYLPATFIYDDPGITNTAWVDSIRVNYNVSSTLYQLAGKSQNGRSIYKYGIGLSLVYLPGFAVAHYLAPTFGFTQDGFSKPYQIGVSLASFTWLLLGLFLLQGILARYYEKTTVWISMLAICLGTNLYEIAVLDQKLVHACLFGLHLLVLWLSIKWVETKSWRFTIALGVFLGWGMLIRPTFILAFLLPVFWPVFDKSSWNDWLKTLFAERGKLIAVLFLSVCVYVIQPLFWKYTTTNWFVYSYTEGFDLFRPYTIPFLFSFKKGWLVYTPMMLFAFLGLVFWFRTAQVGKFAVPLFCFFSLWLLSSWETWWYGGSFSQRAMVDGMGIWAFGMAAFVGWLAKHSRLRQIVMVTGSLLIVLNLFQTHQYQLGIIDPERMTAAYYKASFLKLQVGSEEHALKEVDRDVDMNTALANDQYGLHKRISISFDDLNENGPVEAAFRKVWQPFVAKMPQDETGRPYFEMSSAVEFSPAVHIPYQDFASSDHIWLVGKLLIRPRNNLKERPFGWTASFHHGKRTYQYYVYGSENQILPIDSMVQLTFTYITPHLKRTDDTFKFYLWNYGGADVDVYGFEFEVWTPKRSYVTW
jgi:hypothetical protein